MRAIEGLSLSNNDWSLARVGLRLSVWLEKAGPKPRLPGATWLAAVDPARANAPRFY